MKSVCIIFSRQDNEYCKLTFNSWKFKMRNQNMKTIKFIICKYFRRTFQCLPSVSLGSQLGYRSQNLK